METEDAPTHNDADDGNAEQGSGDRPESPAEGTSPPGNPDVDAEKVEQAEEEADSAKPY